MALSRERTKNRKGTGRYAGIPHAVMNHPDFIELSATAVRLLLELAKQYNGHNNGDLTAAWTVMHKRGVGKSKTTLTKAVRELEEKRFIIRTREGRFLSPGGRCALYALTWVAIDECIGKDLEVKPTPKPPRSFTLELIKTPGTESVPSGYRKCTDGAKNHA